MIINSDIRFTIASLSMAGFWRIKSTTFPLLNQGIATAGISWVDEVRDHMAQMFG
jgi:hypothetical protein